MEVPSSSAAFASEIAPSARATQAQAFEAPGLLAIHGVRFSIWWAPPTTAGKFIEQASEQCVAEDAKLLAAIRQRLHAHAENPFEFEEFAPSDGLAASADFGAERLRGHEKCSSETMRGLLVVNIRSHVKNHMAQLVRHRKALPFAPIPSIDNDHGCDASAFAMYSCGEAIDVPEGHGENLDATLLQDLDQVRDRIQAQLPVGAKSACPVLRFGGIGQHGPRSLPGLIPSHARQAEKLLDRKIPFQIYEAVGRSGAATG